MTEKTAIDLFNMYISFWIVELQLDGKYKFVIKKDNRINCYAYVEHQEGYTYLIKFNSKKLNAKWKIINVLLHELGHILHDLRTSNEEEHEYVAELFALSKAKVYYPEYYNKMVNWTKQAVRSKKIDKPHQQGYERALKELGEL